MQLQLLYPLLVMVFITFAVLFRLGYLRVSYLQKQRIHPQTVADRKGAAEVFHPINHLADHFQNLFEVPVLFYLLVVLLLVLAKVDMAYVLMAWLFVAGRLVHTVIHCSYNNVRHRFVAFLLSSLVLMGMWGRLLVQLAMRQ